MTGSANRRRAARLLALVPMAGLVLLPSTATASAAKARAITDVQVRITDVTPAAAPRSEAPRPLTFTLTLTNTTDTALSNVSVLAYRGTPIGTQQALDQSFTETSPPTDARAVPATTPVEVDVPAHSSVPTTFATKISIQDDDSGVCQCANSVYPIFLTASAKTSGVLGSASTYVPAQVDATVPTKVSWVWPLVDRPHRLTEDTLFTDDTLASSVASGGRLDRALQVLERLGPTLPLTLVVDPELIDELQVMATSQYTVRSGNQNVTGTGGAAARTWLGRLNTVLATHPAVHVSLTPYADPDVQSLAKAGLTWMTVLPTVMQRRVSAALRGRDTDTDVAWPAGGTVGRKALDAMAASGATTIVVDGSALRPSTSNGVPVAVATLRTSGDAVTATATAPAVQRLVAEAVGPEVSATTGSTALPYLVAETAVRSIQAGNTPSSLVLTPPRYVDADPARAARAIAESSRSPFATPFDLRGLRNVRPAKSSSLRTSKTSGGALPRANLDAGMLTSQAVPAVGAMLARDSNARSVVTGLAHGMQRVASSAWLPGTSSPFGPAAGATFAAGLTDRVRTLLDGVRIVPPAAGSGSYTLGSRDSSLPITVENKLPYSVDVDVTVASRDGLPGYSMRDVGTQRIAARSKQTVQVKSHLERSGRIPVEARLTAPTGRRLGLPVQLYVRSTVFGTIGIWITVGAGAVLVIALVVRFGRRLQRIKRKSAQKTRPSRNTPAGTVTS